MTYSDIIERLEKAEGPDRELDADIYIAFNIPAERVGRIDRLGGCVGWWPKDAPYESAVDVPHYTASLDAAVALVERVLPKWQGMYLGSEWTGITFPGNGVEYRATLRRGIHSYTLVEGKGATQAISLLVALFRALEWDRALDAKERADG